MARCEFTSKTRKQALKRSGLVTRPATIDELHVFLVGEIARRNRTAADLQRPIIPGREDRAVEMLLASVSACGLSIVRDDHPIQGSEPIGWKE